MKISFMKTFACIAFATCSLFVNAQISNTLYFDKYNPRQHKVNPSFQPEGKFYIGMPGLSMIGVAGGNSRFTFDDIFQNVEINGEKSTVLFMDRNSSGMDNFLNKLKFKERVFAAYRIDLIDFGLRLKHNDYLTVGISNRMETMVIVPHQIPGIVFGGMANHEVYDFRLNRLSASSTVFSEIAVGYSKKVNEKLSLGGKFKFLLGHDNLYTDFYKVKLIGNEQKWSLKGDASIHGSIPGLRFVPNETGQIDEVEFDDDQSVSCYIKPKGYGAALDLGVSYQVLPYLQLSAGVLDLGFIRWNKELVQLDKKNDFVFDGASYDINDDSTNYFKDYGEQLKDLYQVNENPKAYTSSLCAKFNVGAEFSLWKDRIGLGVLSKTYLFRRTAWEEFLLSASFRPNRWVSLSVTYGLFDGEWNNLSAGLDLNLGPVNLYMAMDNIPLRYAKCDDVKFPSNDRSLRANLGLAFVFGYKDRIKDEDKDGIPDAQDLCPNTPVGVAVDSLGCPLDGDGDGVPDYLDRCSDTPEGVAVDSLGCPLDADGDGVPDYLDRCSDTPEGVAVDSLGCPLDGDGDGVPDYMDKCPNTPSEAKGFVDAAGCLMDSDGDGIPDYLDKCPQIAAPGMENGCPEVKEEVKEVFKKALTGIQFESSKSIIKKSSYKVLDEIVNIMQENPSYKLSIVGHTDASGDPEKNKVLSIDRANAVKTYLVNKGVEVSRISSIGLGDILPLESNATAAGRAKNRRVEFEVEY